MRPLWFPDFILRNSNKKRRPPGLPMIEGFSIVADRNCKAAFLQCIRVELNTYAAKGGKSGFLLFAADVFRTWRD